MKLKHLIKITLISLAALILLGYAGFAFRDIFRGPKISIIEPVNGETYSTSTVAIRGIAERVQSIELNGKSILIDQQGNFSEILVLFPGYNVETVKATDRFGRSIETKIELMKK